MCGILGYSHTKAPLPEGLLTSAIKDLYHRGPDDSGQFSSGSMSLGAVRLSIRDVAHGHQPMFSPDRNVVIVFNGEIYNHGELRPELEKLGHRFETKCDTEVVLKAFLQWGVDAFARLRGMFAIAVWDEWQRKLTLARDRMGIKPLYYFVENGEIFFGSELKCILAHPDVPRQVNLAGLNCYLSLNWVPAPHTLVAGITKLMPGDFLEWQDGRVQTRTYVPSISKAPQNWSLPQSCEELDYLLTEAVREQLVSDVPLGIWLSGGIDSSTILHYAAKAYPGTLNTFSITFKGRSFDESRYMEEVSKQYGTNHFDFDLNPETEMAGPIEQIAYYSDEPSADAGALPVWFLAKMTRRHVTVVLSGEGADELFAGYLTYQADRYREIAGRFPAGLRRLGLAAANLLPVSDDKISFEYKLKRFLQGSLLTPEIAHVFWNGTFSEAEKRDIYRYADAKPVNDVVTSVNGHHGLERFLQFDQRYYLADDILYKVDRMSMAHSLEARPPFLDPRIVDFAARLPENFKMSGGTTKLILRELMKDKLPRSVLKRPKIGFDIPIHDWFRGELRPLLLDTLSEQAVKESGLFYWPAIKNCLDAHLQRKANLGYHLWGLMVLFIWMKRWNIQPARPQGSEALWPLDTVGSLSSPLPSSSS